MLLLLYGGMTAGTGNAVPVRGLPTRIVISRARRRSVFGGDFKAAVVGNLGLAPVCLNRARIRATRPGGRSFNPSCDRIES